MNIENYYVPGTGEGAVSKSQTSSSMNYKSLEEGRCQYTSCVYVYDGTYHLILSGTVGTSRR